MDITHLGAITIDPPIPYEEFSAPGLILRDVSPRVVERAVDGVPGAYQRLVTAIEPTMQVFSGYHVTDDLQAIVDRFGEGRTFDGRFDCWCAGDGSQFRHAIQDGRAIVVHPQVIWPDTIVRQVLTTPMPANDADAATVGEYLTRLLDKVWEDPECFNGKRPFGSGAWEREVYAALVQAGLVAGELDERGRLVDVDGRAAHQLVTSAIRELWFGADGDGGDERDQSGK